MNEEKIIQLCFRLFREGKTWRHIGRAVRKSPAWVRRRVDPEFKRRENLRGLEYYRAGKRPFTNKPREENMIRQPLNNEELEKRRELIPEDTRDLTARVFGDPIPGDPRRPWLP